MFCRHCGNELPDSSKFCRFCGEKVDERDRAKAIEEEAITEEVINAEPEYVSPAASTIQAAEAVETVKNAETAEYSAPLEKPQENFKEFIPDTPESTADNSEEKKKKSSLKSILIIGAVAAIILIALVGAFLGGVFGGNKDTEANLYLYVSDGDYKFYNKKDKKGVKLEDFVDDGSMWSNIYTEDGKYLFYLADDDGEYNLMRLELAKGREKDTIKIDREIDASLPWYAGKDGKMVYYVKNQNLYMNDGSERTKLISDISFYFLNDDGTKLFYINKDKDEIRQAAIDGKMIKEDEKVVSDFGSIVKVENDPFTVYFLKEGALYRKEFGKDDDEKIAKDCYSVVSVEEGKVYYVKETENNVAVGDFFEDDMLAADSALKEPVYEDYVIKKEILIDESFIKAIYVVEEADYEDDADYYETDIKGKEYDYGSGDFIVHVVEANGEYRFANFVYTYICEDENFGKEIGLNDEAIANVEEVEVNGVNGKYTATVSWGLRDKFEEDYIEYENAAYRNEFRSEIEGLEITESSKELRYFDGKDDILVASDLRTIEGRTKDTIIYSVWESGSTGKLKMSELSENGYYSKYDLMEAYTPETNAGKSLFVVKNGAAKAVDVDDVVSTAISADGSKLYVLAGIIADDSDIDYSAVVPAEAYESEDEKKSTELKYYEIELKDGTPGKASVIAEDAEDMKILLAGDGSYILARKQSDGMFEISSNGKDIDSDVYMADDTGKMISGYDGGYAYLYDISEKSGAAELKIWKNGKDEFVADDVMSFYVEGSNIFFVNSDEELYLYNGKEAVLVDDDIEDIGTVNKSEYVEATLNMIANFKNVYSKFFYDLVGENCFMESGATMSLGYYYINYYFADQF